MEQEATVTSACSIVTSVVNTTSFSTTTTTFPLTSKRLKLCYMKQLAKALELPTSATGSDLLVMITGKLRESNRDPVNVQVVVTHKEEGKELSLQDMDGVFLHFVLPSEVSSLSVSPMLGDREMSVPSLMTGSSRTSPTPSDNEAGEVLSDVLAVQGKEEFAAEEEQVEGVLKLMQQTILETRAKLEESQQEVVHLRAELVQQEQMLLEAHKVIEVERAKVLEMAQESEIQKKLMTSQIEALGEEVKQGKEKIKQLWKVNCQQLVSHDNAMFEKEKEMELLSDKLHGVEIELARLKAEKLVLPCPSGMSLPVKLEQPSSGGGAGIKLLSHGSAAYPLQSTVGLTQPEQSISSTRQPRQFYGIQQSVQPAMRTSGMTGVTSSCMSFTDPLIVNRSTISTAVSGLVPPSTLPAPSVVPSVNPLLNMNPAVCRRGKAPPIDEFTAQDNRVTLDDWLPILERAATWNGWSPEEMLMQLVGHLRGRALQEWKLMSSEDRATYQSAIKTFRERLDPGNQTLAALDFRHASQKPTETVSDFIRRLEEIFQIAFGREKLSNETRDMLLYGQLQEGLLYTLIESPTVSGAQSYKELCLAARKEEKRLAELKKKQQYLKNEKQQVPQHKYQGFNVKSGNVDSKTSYSNYQKSRRCYLCNSASHLAKDCKVRKSESQGKKSSQNNKPPDGMKMILSESHRGNNEKESRYVEVKLEGVPVTGLIDTGSDINIIRGDLFYMIVEKAGLELSHLKAPDHKAFTYDQKPVTLDGQMNMTFGFGEKVLHATVYVKLVAPDQLLLSETVCHQLGIVSYHPSVKAIPRCAATNSSFTRSEAKKCVDSQVENICKTATPIATRKEDQTDLPKERQQGSKLDTQSALDKTVVVAEERPGYKESNTLVESTSKQERKVSYVKLVTAVRLPARYSAVVPVKVTNIEGTALVKPLNELSDSLEVGDTLVEVRDGYTAMMIMNGGDTTCELEVGKTLGQVSEVEIVEDPLTVSNYQSVENDEDVTKGKPLNVYSVSLPSESAERTKWRQLQLMSLLEQSESSLSEDHLPLRELLTEYHSIFSIEDDERGETDMIEFEISTGDGAPKRQPVRRIPFAARQEVIRQLERMQRIGVIQPSKSPWASPVVLVRKRDGSLRFCIDYRALNSVTKPDLFPLPRINDLMDQLGASRCFTTLDLAAGYWQIKVRPDSQEKTAFITHEGLFEFRVMPFGVMNAPAVFQRLMQRVLAGLKTECGKEFVSVYLDDVIIFSETLQDHVRHLRMVFDRIRAANLKLNPKKCKFMCDEVDYLGHLVTPAGLRPNNRNLDAVKHFPVPTNLRQLRQFLGLTSHYRRFIMNYSQLAHPLYQLTRKGALFHWTADCESAFESLRMKLITAPVLAYPNFDNDFVLETDASKQGLGAILSQYQTDRRLHPVAYASRSVSLAEANYAITDLETLAVVWAVTHFRYHLYGHVVTIITDHAAVKAILGAPNLSGKHARWWSRVYGSGIKKVEIVHRAGNRNQHADALSRQPVEPAPAELVDAEVQIATISTHVHDSDCDINSLLEGRPGTDKFCENSFGSEQMNDATLQPLLEYLLDGKLPTDPTRGASIMTQASDYTTVDGILYFVGQNKDNVPRVVVPEGMRQKLIEEYHAGNMSGHFSGPKIYRVMSRLWWWRGMYRDIIDYARNCPQCIIVAGSERRQIPPMHSIPVDRPFQILGVDIMELPVTANGNRYVVVFQDFFTKWPMVFPTRDQKAKRIAELLVNEIVPMFGVPEALLSDRGTNLLSCLMQDVCKLLGIRKLNTTAHHPQCNGMVERFNRTLKTMLRKHVSKFGVQWDVYLSGVLWAYRNTPHSSTGEKPSFLLFGFDCRHPTEAATLPTKPPSLTDISDYREELVLSLSSARALAKKSMTRAQHVQQAEYNKRSRPSKVRIGDWVMIHFPQEETGKQRKLSRPWHGPYRVVSREDPDVTATKVHFPSDPPIHVHQSRVNKCPQSMSPDFYCMEENDLDLGDHLC